MKATKKELFYNDFSDKWEKRINKAETEKRLRVVFEELLGGINIHNKKFLEVGCGLGFFSEKAVMLGAEVTGIDVGKKLIDIVKKRVPGGIFITASSSNLPFKSRSFDIILCTEVIEHVDNQEKSISEMIRVLKDEGVLVITTPNRIFKPIFDLLSVLGIRPYHGNEEWLFPWAIRRLFEGKGIITREKHFNFIYPGPVFDLFENLYFLRFLMINQGYLIKKN